MTFTQLIQDWDSNSFPDEYLLLWIVEKLQELYIPKETPVHSSLSTSYFFSEKQLPQLPESFIVLRNTQSSLDYIFSSLPMSMILHGLAGVNFYP